MSKLALSSVPLETVFLLHFLANSILLQIVGRVLSRMVKQNGDGCIEDHPDFLWEALCEALALVGPVKSYDLASFSAHNSSS